jgi:hypothetical protein
VKWATYKDKEERREEKKNLQDTLKLQLRNHQYHEKDLDKMDSTIAGHAGCWVCLLRMCVEKKGLGIIIKL